jgi:hypothetical protein
MEAITLNNTADSYRTGVYQLYQSELDSYKVNQLKQAFRPSYHLNDEELQTLQVYFRSRYVIPAHTGKLRESSHPVLASLNQYCNEDARNSVQELRSRNYKVISIGDGFNQKINADHNCLLIRSNRDQYRLIDSVFTRDRNSHDVRVVLNHDIRAPMTTCCQNGAQNCHFRADVAYAMHSLYDITPEQVVDIFHNHQLKKMYAYIYFPFSFFHKSLAKLDAKIFNCALSDDDVIIDFSMNDFSFTYKHDLANWKKWSTVTQIHINSSYTINIEVVRSYGPLMLLDFVLTLRGVDVVSRHIPLADLCDDLCLVPDVTVAIHHKLALRQDDCPHIAVPQHVVNHIMAYVTRVADEAYKFTEVAALASGMLRAVKIGSVVYAKRWETNADEYHRVLLSLFILGAISRQDRTRNVSAAFKNMKNWRDSVFVIFRQLASSMISTLQHPFLTGVTGESDPNDINSWYIWHYHIRQFRSYNVNDVVRVKTIYLMDPLTVTQPFAYDLSEARNPLSVTSDTHTSIAPTSTMLPRYEIDYLEYHREMVPLDAPFNRDLIQFSSDSSSDSDVSLTNLFDPSMVASVSPQRGVATTLVRSDSVSSYTSSTTIDTDAPVVPQTFVNQMVTAATPAPLLTIPPAVVQPTKGTIAPPGSDGEIDLTHSVNADVVSEALSQLPKHVSFASSFSFKDAIRSKATGIAKSILVKPRDKFQPSASNGTQCRIIDITGDLFQATTSLGHCVAEDMAMYAGIALEFRNRFNRVDELLKQKPRVGKTVFLKDGNRYIYYIVSKASSNGKPTMSTLRCALVDLSAKMLTHGVTSISIPRIGSGLDKLNPQAVRDLIREIFRDLPYTIYIHTPPSNTSINSQPLNTAFDSNCPPKLAAGHCMMQSVCEAAGLKYTNQKLFQLIENTASDFMFSACDFSTNDVKQYLYSRNYQNNPFTDYVFTIMSELFDLNITIENLATKRSVSVGQGRNRIVVYYRPGAEADTGHYTSYAAGGAADKFPALMAELIDRPKGSFAELSAAPGANFSQMIANPKYATIEKHAFVYTPGIKPAKLLDAKIKFYNYDNIDEIPKRVKNLDFVFCDAARACNSESIVDNFAQMIPSILAPGANVMIKTFANPISTWRLATHFESYKTFIGVGTEVYYLLKNFGTPVITFDEIRADNFAEITTHCIPYCPNQHTLFAANFFREIKIGAASLKPNMKIDRFTIQAMTGFASSAKTTKAVEHFKGRRFCMIAPTKKLTITHGVKFGVNSYTPHQALTQVHQYDLIIIDEISSFDYRYLYLVHCAAPKAEIVVLGDKYQTRPYSELGNVKTVFDFGVTNNMYDVYAVPKDIVDALNEKYSLAMNFAGDVQKGLCTFKGKLEDLINFQIIALNDETVQDLTSRGFKANTITTYQGSREPVVVFYIDTKAVTSKLINYADQVYTAMTRATGKLVLYGESAYITKFFNISGLEMRTIEELNDVRLYNDTRVHDVDDPDHQSQTMISQIDEGPAREQVFETATQMILENTLKPVNPPEYLYNYDPNMPPVTGGLLSTNFYNLQPGDKEVKAFVFNPNTTLIRNQVSDDPVITIDTLIKRYGKRSRKFTALTDVKMKNALMKGLVKALYGNDHSYHKLKRDLHSTPEELSQAYGDYIERLNKKLIGGADSKIFSDLQADFNEFDEKLDFINKRQGKYDPEDAFDSKLKAGQGVASMSKRVNILFAAYAQLMLEKIQRIAKQNNRNIIFATHGSDNAISELLAALEQEYPSGVHACNDIKEWDASFLKFMSMFFCDLLLLLGCPQNVVDWFLQYRLNWFMANFSKMGITSLAGFLKQFSGSPFTIAENTIVNCAFMFAIMDYINLLYAFMKGDDSNVKCYSAKLTTFGRDLIAATGHKLKMHVTEIGEFAGFLITPYGFFPDILRKASKFFGKAYRDNAHFQEAQKSAFASTTVVKSQQHLEEGLIRCELYYNSIFEDSRINAEQCRTLFNSIRHAHEFKFSDLTPKTFSVLKSNF